MRRLIILLSLISLTACAPAVVQPVIPTPTAMPTITPPAAAQPIDLSPYRQAMKPAFAAEVDRFGDATQYQIDLEIAPDLTSYSATQQVHYINTETTPLKEVYFRLFPNYPSYGGDMTMHTVTVNGQEVTPTYELGNSAMRLALSQPLLPGEGITFELTYSTEVPTRSVTAGYNQFGFYQDVLALPNFYPLIPVYDNEGWNVETAPGYGDAVFSDTALYQVNITAPSDQVVVTSGVCDQAVNGATQTDRCVSGPMRDFMIALSADYDVVSETVDGAHINSYFLTKDAEQGRAGLATTVAAMKSYSQRIGPYPFNELDVIETPTTAGGIEYPGLVVIAQDLYEQNPSYQEGATAHEVAHQWWYSLVGNDQVDDPWLDEAFTQFTTALYYLDRYGTPGFDSYVANGLQARYQLALNNDQDMPGDLPVASYTEQEYGRIVYGKAPLFFKALYEASGDAKFDQFMQDYFQTYRYRIAYPKDLLAIAAKYVDQPTLDEAYQEWLAGPK